MKPFLFDVKYFNDYKHGLKNYVDFVTNMKHPYVFSDSDTSKQNVKSHKVSSILAGLTSNDNNNNKLNQLKNIHDKHTNYYFA